MRNFKIIICSPNRNYCHFYDSNCKHGPSIFKNVINIIFGNKFIETANALNVIVCISVIVIFNLLCSVLALSLV